MKQEADKKNRTAIWLFVVFSIIVVLLSGNYYSKDLRKSLAIIALQGECEDVFPVINGNFVDVMPLFDKYDVTHKDRDHKKIHSAVLNAVLPISLFDSLYYSLDIRECIIKQEGIWEERLNNYNDTLVSKTDTKTKDNKVARMFTTWFDEKVFATKRSLEALSVKDRR